MKKYNILSEFFNVICNSSSSYADHACMIVNNLSRSKNGSEWCLNTLCESDFKLLKTLLEVYCNVGYNTAKCSLDYLGSLFANLTQLHEGLFSILIFYAIQYLALYFIICYVVLGFSVFFFGHVWSDIKNNDHFDHLKLYLICINLNLDYFLLFLSEICIKSLKSMRNEQDRNENGRNLLVLFDQT